MKNPMSFVLPAIIVIAAQACSLPKYDAGSYVPASNTSGVSTSSTDPVNSRPTDGTTFTGATPTGANSGTTPFSAGPPSMGTANSTSSGISGEDLEADERNRENTNFITQASVRLLSVIELSDLATNSAQNGAVKNLASTVVRDYGKANDELKDLAVAKGISLPQSNTPGLKTLSALPANDFDQAYLKMIALEQQKALALFKQASQYSDPSLKAYVGKYAPALRNQEKQAVTLGRKLK